MVFCITPQIETSEHVCAKERFGQQISCTHIRACLSSSKKGETLQVNVRRIVKYIYFPHSDSSSRDTLPQRTGVRKRDPQKKKTYVDILKSTGLRTCRFVPTKNDITRHDLAEQYLAVPKHHPCVQYLVHCVALNTSVMHKTLFT